MAALREAGLGHVRLVVGGIVPDDDRFAELLELVRAADVEIAGEARQRVLELRQLDLQLAVPAAGTLGEDVEDELRSIDRLEPGL